LIVRDPVTGHISVAEILPFGLCQSRTRKQAGIAEEQSEIAWHRVFGKLDLDLDLDLHLDAGRTIR
jgi:hypothetical protein